MKLDDTKTIKELKISYKELLEPTDPSYNPNAPFIDWSPETQMLPAITKWAGSMQFKVIVVWDDDTEQAQEEASANLSFRISAAYDEQGNPLDANVLANVTQEGKLTALGTGCGKVTLRIASNNYPDFSGVDVDINIQNNNGASHAITKAEAYVKTQDATDYVPLSEGDPYITLRYGDCTLDALLTFDDDTTAFARDLGIDAHWKITGSYTNKGALATTDLAKVSPNGMVNALGTGNGTVTLSGNIGEEQFAVIVHISGNAQEGKAEPTPLMLTFKYRDVNTKFAEETYSESELPEIVKRYGSCSLVPYIQWSDGSVSLASLSGYQVRWKMGTCTDLDGNPIATVLALIGSSGVVYAQGNGNGIASFSCELVGTSVISRPQTLKVEVRGNDESVSVDSIEILRSDGSSYGDDAVDLNEVGNLVHFCARVNYSDGTSKSTLAGDYIRNLIWKTYRAATDEEEIYSKIDENGQFSIEGGFRDCRVKAIVQGGGFYGQDVSKTVRVSKESAEDQVGSTSELTLHVVESAEYEKNGSSATAAKEVTLSSSQLASAGSAFSEWYTFRKKNGGWGTLYSYGVSIPNLLSLAGLDTKDVLFMQFSDNAGYTGDSGFYSADVIMGSRYRYSNYYMHTLSSDPSYLGQSSVVPMIALSLNFDYGRDPNEGSGYSNMTNNSCMRLVMGMTGVDDGNARRMVRCLSDITVIVVNKENEDDPDPVVPDNNNPGTGSDGTGSGLGGQGTGSGAGDGQGGGIGSSGGVASEGQGGGEAAGGEEGGGGILSSETPSNIRLRELVDNTQETNVLDDYNKPWRWQVLAIVLLVLIASALYKARCYRRQVAAGERMAQSWDEKWKSAGSTAPSQAAG